MALSKSSSNKYYLIYMIFALFLIDVLRLPQNAITGWIGISLIIALGILLKRPVEAFAAAARTGTISPLIRNIVYCENIAVILIAFQYEHNLLVAFIGVIVILFTIYLGTKFKPSKGLTSDND
ncbi:MAG: hypothetical protein ACE3L7_32770 [Candidatus Pristimantibacillus sp.]